MPFDTDILTLLGVSAIEMIIYSYYYKNFLGKKFTGRLIYPAVYAAYFLVNIFVPLISTVNLTFFMTISCNLIISICFYKGSLTQSVFSAGLVLSYTTVTETLAVVLFSWGGKYVFPVEPDYGLSYFIAAAIAKILHFLVILVIVKVIKKRKTPMSAASGIHLLSLLAIVFICVFLSTMNLNFALERNETATPGHVLMELGILVISVLVFFVFEKLLQYSQRETEAKIFQHQTLQSVKELEYVDQYQSELRGIKHDVTLHLTSIHQCLLNKDYAALDEYVTRYLGETSAVIFEIFTGVSSVDLSVAAKKRLAEQKNIQVSVRASKVHDVKINPVHLNMIIGNALDNAIEACERLGSNKAKYIEVGLKTEGGMFFIKISNSSLPIVMNEDGFPITTKDDKQGHGYGLINIRRAAEKYDGEVCLEYKDEAAHFTAMLQNEMSE